MLLTYILEAEGAQVTASGCASEALKALEQECPDILISDIVMPEMNGYSLIRKVRNCEAMAVNSILAIALTAKAGIESHQQALSAGFHCCLFKPLEPAQLVEEIIMLTQQFLT